MLKLILFPNCLSQPGAEIPGLQRNSPEIVRNRVGHSDTGGEFDYAMNMYLVFNWKHMMVKYWYTGTRVNIFLPQALVDGIGIVLAMISNERKTELVQVPGIKTVLQYRDEFLQPHLIQVIDRYRELFI